MTERKSSLDQANDGDISRRKRKLRYLRCRMGCLTCRRRRKKCDEVKPICAGCTRNVLDCSWPPDAVDDNGKKSGAEVSAPRTQTMSSSSRASGEARDHSWSTSTHDSEAWANEFFDIDFPTLTKDNSPISISSVDIPPDEHFCELSAP